MPTTRPAFPTADLIADASSEPDNGASSLLSRRRLFQAGAAGAAAVAFASLAGQPAFANDRRLRDATGGYGPLAPTPDQATGLELLALPPGFSYTSFGWTGQIMSDGRPTPTDHDGMAVVARRPNGKVVLVRNHENSEGEGPQALVDGGMYNPIEYGGTTNLVFDTRRGRFVDDFTTLGGTIRNCAGGATSWRSWLSCEETFHPWGERDDGFNHGYIFDVPAYSPSNGAPIRAAGRFSHEAVAVDPRTGIVYETEDARPAGLYAYMNPGGTSGIRDGGDLLAWKAAGEDALDVSVSYPMGTTLKGEWVPVADPEGIDGRPLDSAPGAALFSRLEGAWYDRGLVFIVSTDGGDAGLGSIWVLNPKNADLTLLYESTDASVLDGPDNIATSPSGGLIFCEDGDSDPKRLVGLSRQGNIFHFAENVIELRDGDIDTIDKVYPGTKANFWDDPVGNFTSREWAGATFFGDWLFVNIQSPGVTFAITGPWFRGGLK
ncbi:MAG: alkaline phosphatase PhoX [Actinomycetota bacterium]